MSSDISSDIPPPTKEPNPLKEEFIKNVKAHAKKKEEYERKIKTIEQEMGPINWCYNPKDDHGEPKEFNASDLRDMILNERSYNILTDKHTQVIYLYTQKTGIYHKDGEQYLEYLIDRVLGDKSTTRKISETIELLKIKTYAEIEPSQKIAVKNGLLDVKTEALEDFSPYEFNTNKLDVEYKEGIKSELWENFIDQVCPDDKLLLQEWSGYLLLKCYSFHAIMWLYGPTGRNGKGAWARTMQSILGESNHSNVSIDEFDGKHRFALYNLKDKLFNICSEPRTDRVLSVELLQMLTGQDSIDAERKGVQDRFKFKNTAKITVMGNKFPKLNKPTEAFWERLKLCKFPNQYTGSNQIQDIENQWLNDPEQKSGVLNWMLAGLHRLLKHGFSQTQTQTETIIQFKRASDTIASFLMEQVEFSINEVTIKVDAYEHYKKYCDYIGVTNESYPEFSRKLHDHPKIKDTSKRIDGKKKKVWGGFKLKPLNFEDVEEEEANEQTKLTFGTTGTSGTASIPREYFETSKKCLDIHPVPAVPTVPEKKSVMRFQRVNSRVESHKCDNPKCENEKAILAEFKQLLDVETVKEIGKAALYFCPDCFKNAKANAEKDGVKFVEVPMDEPTDDYREGF